MDRNGTKDKILDTARELFNRHSFDGTSMDEIAKSLGVTKAALYYHFKSKDELLYALLERTVTGAMTSILDGVEQFPPDSQAQREFAFNNALNMVSKYLDVFQIAFAELLKSDNHDNMLLELPIRMEQKMGDRIQLNAFQKSGFSLFMMDIISYYTFRQKLPKAFGVDSNELEKRVLEDLHRKFMQLAEDN